MKIILSKNNVILIRLDKNDELINVLTEYASENKITAGTFTGIGSAKELTCSYYEIHKKKFEDYSIKENIEIVSLTGNIATLSSKPIIHAHGVFSKNNLSTIGGHVKKLLTSATCEITLHILEGHVERRRDEKTNLNLLQ